MDSDLLLIYAKMLKAENNKPVLYYDAQLNHSKFEELDFSDIENIFKMVRRSIV